MGKGQPKKGDFCPVNAEFHYQRARFFATLAVKHSHIGMMERSRRHYLLSNHKDAGRLVGFAQDWIDKMKAHMKGRKPPTPNP